MSDAENLTHEGGREKTRDLPESKLDEAARTDVTYNGPAQKIPEPVQPRLKGPEIPNAKVSESGVFTVRVADTEVYETAEVVFGLGLGLDEARPIEWLWPERIPLGTVTVLEGPSEFGKSLIAADLAARVSRGDPWPGRAPGPNLPGKVLYVRGDLEDWDQMILPRLLQAGAEMRRVGDFSHINTRQPCVESRDQACTERRLHFPEDLGHLEFQIRAYPDMRLVIVDSLAVLCPNAKTRQETLRQLNEIAARRNVAIVISSRPARQPSRNKLVPTVDRRWEAVRCAFNTLRDLDDDRLFYLAPARMTFAEKPQWLPYRIGPTGVVWEAARDAPPEASGISEAMREKRALRDDAIVWLRGELQDGPLAQQRIVREAKQHGFSYGTLRRAKEELKLRSKRIEFGAGISYWAWVLEPEGGEKVEGAEEVPAPVSDVRTYAKTAEKSGARPTAGESNGKDEPTAFQLQEYLAGRGPDLDEAALIRMMTPAMITKLIKERRGLGGDQPARRSRKRRRKRKNGRPTANGHHGSNAKGKG